ncbi:MAG: GNAT family N-acetyltransferase [Victivallales bacterium]|nr:GNAT family N-acetyltransferase [Victivallales bacterium]
MNNTPNISIRYATIADAQAIHDFLIPFSEQRLILARSVDNIREHIGNFLLAVDAENKIAGTVALRDFGNALQEIRTLTVNPLLHGQRIGSQLVLAALDFARRRGSEKVFTLTMRPNLFQRLGFEITDINIFPQKVTYDCLACPKRSHCDEIALLYELKERTIPYEGR